MSEVQAMQKLPCLRCGGDLTWSAGQKALTCPYCGYLPTEAEVEAARVAGRREKAAAGEEPGATRSLDALVEHPLEEGLRRFPREGAGAVRTERYVRCESCRAITCFDKDRAAQRCDFCGSPAIAPVENEADIIAPEGVIPVTLSEAEVRTLLRAWYGNRWFAPNRLKRAALTDTLHGSYLPYWTFDARAQGDWRAESGYYYYETEYYTDSNGHRRSRRVRRVRWAWSEGTVNHAFDDDLVPGVTAAWYDLLRKVEPFVMKELKLYDTIYLRGWVVERYQRDLHEAEAINRRQMEKAMYDLCGSQVPGDTYRNLQVENTFEDRTYKHILVPVWVVSYNYGRKAYRVVVNGSTGAIAGERPYSAVKIILFVLLCLLVFGVIAAWMASSSS